MAAPGRRVRLGAAMSSPASSVQEPEAAFSAAAGGGRGKEGFERAFQEDRGRS